MQIVTVKGVAIESVFACIPENRIDNLAACNKLYGDSAADIVKSVGMDYRCLATAGVSSLDLCVMAGKKLLDGQYGLKEEIGAIVCVTFTPDQLMPANAIAAQAALGLDNDVMAFDLNLACSGYGYGLWLAGSMAVQLGKSVLLLDGDVQSAYTSPYDKGPMPVMADAGTATLVRCSANSIEWNFTFYTDGTNRKALGIPAGGSKRPTKVSDLEYIEYPDGSKRREIDIAMDGFEIFKFVAQTVSKELKAFLDALLFSPEKIDGFVPHQANIYMIKQLARKIGISNEKVWISGDKYGNSASASIPVTIASEFSKKRMQKGGTRVLFSGFGAGLSISAGVVELSDSLRCCLFTYGEG